MDGTIGQSKRDFKHGIGAEFFKAVILDCCYWGLVVYR